MYAIILHVIYHLVRLIALLQIILIDFRALHQHIVDLTLPEGYDLWELLFYEQILGIGSSDAALRALDIGHEIAIIAKYHQH